jgi:MOSC domain-containing protein YiiM
MSGVIVQLSISPGGVPKLPVESAEVGELGLAGDAHRDLRYHGGPDRALCLYSIEQIAHLRAEGHPIEPGFLGENITTRGIDLGALCAGERLRLGAMVEIELTGYASPCEKIQHCFADGRFVRISRKTHPEDARWYARVIVGGALRSGDAVTLVR